MVQKQVKCVKNRKNVHTCQRRCDRNVFFDGFWKNYPNRGPSECSDTCRFLVEKRKNTKTCHVQKVSKMCQIGKITVFHKNGKKKLKKKFRQTGPCKKVCNFCDHFVTLFVTFGVHATPPKPCFGVTSKKIYPQNRVKNVLKNCFAKVVTNVTQNAH